MLKDKSQLFLSFQSFYAEISNQFNAKLLAFRTNNAREYLDSSFKQFLESRGNIHQTSCVCTPQQNGIVKRKNGPILAIARALMLQMNVPKLFWIDDVLTATYLLNRTFSHILKGKSPFEMFPGKYPFSVPSKVFDCVSLFSYERKITRIYILYPYSPYIYSYCSFDSTRSHCSSCSFYLSGLCSLAKSRCPSSSTTYTYRVLSTTSPVHLDAYKSASSSVYLGSWILIFPLPFVRVSALTLIILSLTLFPLIICHLHLKHFLYQSHQFLFPSPTRKPFLTLVGVRQWKRKCVLYS